MRRRGIRVLSVALLLAISLLTPRLDADINGDGTDEVGAFAVEVTGSARGPWYQIWENNGSLVASQFLNAGFTGFQLQTIDVSGNGLDELVILATRISDGAGYLEVRAQGGAVMASKFVTGSLFGKHQLFPINYNGGAASEIGIGFTKTSDGVGSYQIWSLSGANLVMATSRAITGPAFGSLVWQSGDFDGDSTDEVFVGFARTSDGAAAYTVWDPQTNALVGSKFVTGALFSGHQWVISNFNAATAGDEILVGFTRNSDGAAAFQVWTAGATMIGSKFVTGSPFHSHKWDMIADGTTDDQIFVGFLRASDGASVYQVWEPTGTSPAGGRFVLGGAYTVVEWLTGNFDGVANGDEVVVGFSRLSDGAVGFQQWDRAGTTMGGDGFVLSGSFINPSFVSLRPMVTTRDDLLIGAAQASGQPIVLLWRAIGSGGTQLLSKFIFNGDVV